MSPEAPGPPAGRSGDAPEGGGRREAAHPDPGSPVRRPGDAAGKGGGEAARGDRSPVPEVGKYLGLGLTWALSTLLFLWLGTLADGWLGTRPALTLAGAFVGAAAGFYHMVRQLSRNADGRDGARRR